MYRFNPTNPTNRPTGVQVDPLAVHQSPPRVGVDAAGRHTAGEQLYGSPGMVLRTEAWVDDGSSSQVLCCPTHARKLGAWDGEDRTAAVQLGLDLEAAAHLGPVVFGHVAGDPGDEVCQRRGHRPVLGWLLPHQPAGCSAIGGFRPFLSRRPLQLGRGMLEKVIHHTSGCKVVVHTLLDPAVSRRKVYQTDCGTPAFQERL